MWNFGHDCFGIKKNIYMIRYFYGNKIINYNNCENNIKSKVLINSNKFKIIIYLYKKYLFFILFISKTVLPKSSLWPKVPFLCLNIETKNLNYDNV